jgi:hypothetical protein
MRREAAEKCRSSGPGPWIPTVDDPADAADSPVSDFDHEVEATTATAYQKELLSLLQLSDAGRTPDTDADYPLTLSFPFLLCSLSRPALRLARHFLPLLCDSTINIVTPAPP